MSPKRLLTTAEVAERFRTTEATVRYWKWRGTGPRGVKVGRRTLYDEGDVDSWLAGLRDADRQPAA